MNKLLITSIPVFCLLCFFCYVFAQILPSFQLLAQCARDYPGEYNPLAFTNDGEYCLSILGRDLERMG